MKKLIIPLFTVIVFASCGSKNEQPQQNEAMPQETTESVEMLNYYGDTISVKEATPLNELVAKMQGQGKTNLKVEGSILETCPKKGCWMTMDLGNQQQVRVTFKDYGFFVPTEGQTGKTAICEGYAYWDTTSVEVLKHYAEDAGKSQGYIDSISEPEFELAFEATGVIIR